MATILVVEDEVSINDLLRTHLEAEGHTVFQAFNGPSALETVDQHIPHLIILDWMLPGMDGLTVCRRLRQKHLMPVIMLTARTEEVDHILGLEVGADDYISKPFSIRQVLARVRAMLRRVELDSQFLPTTPAFASPMPPLPVPSAVPQPGHPQMSQQQAPNSSFDATPPLERGLLQIYLAQRAVKLNGQEIDLTPKEYDLLVLLAQHPGWVFKREILLQQIWGDDYEGFDRTIDNHITRLRKKLGPAGDQIDTVWGVGYRFVAGK